MRATNFDKYQLIERIGMGGMAEIFLAKSQGAEGFEKQLVIKRILPELSTNKRFVEMFIAEARIAVALNHPNIVQIYDFGKVGEDFFLAMEFVEGWDLGYLTRLSAEVELMSVGDVILIGMEIARGLDYAHRRQDAHGESLGLVHRDISPQNVLVSREGAVKIVDFGIAKATILQDEAPHVVKGKFCYMSPEQARGEEVDHRSDLFSLGVVLFELICGRPLFKQTDKEQTLSLVKSAVVPDLRDLNPSIPESFEHVLYKLLAREPEQRYQTARELQQDLMRVLYNLGTMHDAYTLSDYIDRAGAALVSESEQRTTRESGQTRTVRTNVMPRAAQNEATTAQHQMRTAELGFTPVTPAIEGITDPGRDEESAPLEILSRTRKEVVLIAGVLEGLFALRNEVGQDRWLQIFQEYTRMVDSIAFKNNGVVHRVNESGFVMLLGVPISSENDAERAAGVALDMQDAMSGINLSLTFHPLKLAIGVAISEVILEQGELHHGKRRYNWSFLGDSHEFADQLARAGMGDEILLGSLVWRRVRREYHGVALEGVKFDIGGETRTMQAWRLLHVKSWRERLKDVQHAYHVFHGRELELRSLRSHYRQVLMEGLARGVVVTGSQGMGKSTLVEEFLRGLDPRDVRVVRGVANTLERGTPLGGVSTLLAELMRLGPREDIRQLRATLEMRIEALFPEESAEEVEMLLHSIGAIFGLRYTGGLFEELAGEERRKRTSLSLMKFLRRFAERKPVVLMIDDAHQLDSMTLELATQIFASRYEAPLFLIFVMTPAAMGEFDQARWDRLTDAKYFHQEALSELSEPDARKLCVELLRGQRIEDDSLVDAILHRAGGNPFYIKEVVEILRDRGVLQDSGERRQVMLEMAQTNWLPTSVEGAIAARVDRLSMTQRSLLQRVALLWSPFTWQDVETLFEDVPLEDLESLVQDDLLEHVGEHRGLRDEDGDMRAMPPAQRSYRFHNALTKEVAARTLVAEQAQSLHARLADHLLSQSSSQDVAELVRLAYHLEGAGRTEQAAQAYYDAAKDAFGQFGAAESLKLCDQVIELLPPEHDLTVEVLYLKERALREVGRVTEHKLVLDRLSELVDASHAERQLEVWMRLIRYHYDQADFGAALSTIERARELGAEAKAHAMLARADQFEAYIRLDQGKRSEALELVESAIERLDNLEDRHQRIPEMVSCHNMRGAILRREGRHQEALDTYALAMELAQERLDGDLIGRYVLVNMGLANVYVGRYSRGLECYQRCLKQARRLGLRRDEAGVLVNMGHAYLMCGEYERAISHVQRGVYMARKVNATVTLADGEVTLGMCYAELGKRGLAERVLSEGLRLAESIPHVYLALHAMLAIARLTLDEEEVTPQAARIALMQAEDCEERAERAGMRWGQLGALVIMARAYDTLGMGSRAQDTIARAWELVLAGEEVGMEHAAETYAIMLHRQNNTPQALAVLEHVITNTEQRLDTIEDPEDRTRFLDRPSYSRVRTLHAEFESE